MSSEPKDGLEAAIAAIGGNASQLAREVGVSPQCVTKWRRLGLVPIERVPAVERVSSVPRWRLRPDRPDLFPPPLATAAAATG